METSKTTDLSKNEKKKPENILVYGDFDKLEPKDFEFLWKASQLGNLHIRIPANHITDQQKLFMMNSISYICSATTTTNDFETDIKALKPSKSFNYNKEKTFKTPALKEKPKVLNIYQLYKVDSLNKHTQEQKNKIFPWRLCILGGWLDQPFVSKIYPGGVIVVNVKFNEHFRYRSGLATSSRECGINLWNGNIPKHIDNVNAAKLLFGAENPPGKNHISGSQDHLGVMLPGINFLKYDGDYWPYDIEQILNDKKILYWLQSVLYVVRGKPRNKDYDPLSVNYINLKNVKLLSEASKMGWDAIKNCDVKQLGEAFRKNNIAWKQMLPLTVPDDCGWKEVDKRTYGCLVTHGGGYVICASDKPVKDGFQIEINTQSWCPNSKNINTILKGFMHLFKS